MPRFDRSEIFRGARLELDCSEPAHLRSTPPRAPRYGEPIAEIRKRQTEMQRRLEMQLKDRAKNLQ